LINNQKYLPCHTHSELCDELGPQQDIPAPDLYTNEPIVACPLRIDAVDVTVFYFGEDATPIFEGDFASRRTLARESTGTHALRI
jgi:hypothetical protein